MFQLSPSVKKLLQNASITNSIRFIKYKRIPDENWIKLPFAHSTLSQKYKHTHT